MAFTTPSVDDFKAQFVRDFPYAVPAFGAAASLTLVAGVITAAAVTSGGRLYTDKPTVAVVDLGKPPGAGAVLAVTIAAGKVTALAVTAGGAGYLQPVVQFSGGAGDNTDLSRVTDDDITGAIQDASFNVNQGLFADQSSWSRAFLFYVAHCLVERLLASGEGVRSRYNWLTTSKTAGDLSTSHTIPDSILKSPFLASISTTRYGARYLEIIAPLLVGNMATNFRQTPP